ncbi:MAG: hypothetical protein F6K08_10995 [Okeania sp. SIO1H6]|nr:hypothetical protein [Okeania sp. SIO1H6]
MATTQSAFAGTVFKDLGNLGDPDNNWHFSLGLSDDGSVITGTSRRDPLTQEAFRWTAELGMEGLGFLPGGGSFSVGWAISGDGSTIVGRSDTVSGEEAFYWTKTDGMQGLGHLSGGGNFSEANGVSFDGSVIVGSSDTASGEEAFYWTETDGMQGLGNQS